MSGDNRGPIPCFGCPVCRHRPTSRCFARVSRFPSPTDLLPCWRRPAPFSMKFRVFSGHSASRSPVPFLATGVLQNLLPIKFPQNPPRREAPRWVFEVARPVFVRNACGRCDEADGGAGWEPLVPRWVGRWRQPLAPGAAGHGWGAVVAEGWRHPGGTLTPAPTRERTITGRAGSSQRKA